MSFARLRIAAVCCAAALLAGPMRAEGTTDQNAVNAQSAYQAPLVQVSRLQVTGAVDKLTLDVEHADVQSTLKAVLKQAGRQFVPDATVTGQVTLLLTDQPLDTVLRAVCDQCYLKYIKTSTGIFRFTRDDEAIKKAFADLKQLNSQTRLRLDALGLAVPTDEQLKAARARSEPAGALGGGFAGQSRGAAGGRDAAKSDITADRNLLNGAQGAASANNVPSNSTASRMSAAPGVMKKEAPNKIANVHADYVAQGDLGQFLSPNARGNASNLQQYSFLLRQNGFVWFNIPEEKPEPVASVLQLFSQQSNTPILVDQSIPNSLKFRVWGNLSPRQLPEALNILAPTAHLQWRWIGNSVFVVPAPNFQVFFGDQNLFRNSYPSQQRGESGAAADSKERRGGQE